MTQTSRLYWLHGLSPLHVGAGEGVGAIDLPIMREKATQWPMIPGSSIKGVQRDYYLTRTEDEKWINRAFGTGGDQDANAGALVMTDSRILAFPVGSRYGTFAYVTCPLVLKRMRRDVKSAGLEAAIPLLEQLDIFDRQLVEGTVQAWVAKGSVLGNLKGEATEATGQVYLDEFEGTARVQENFTAWAAAVGKQLFEKNTEEREIWQQRIILVSDDTFQYFVTMCCEIEPRIRINEETKTVKKGALWYEEYVPTEAVFYGMIWCDQVSKRFADAERDEMLGTLAKESILQIGGNASVGKGRMRCLIPKGGKA
ncbi:type III-B CRISPR module RAMP protein Cmr4 [Saccharibacillus sp. CPCC 101409]|uniref:type III-B CRISPR module RAMP protein Cmr4 n=1 Tax=Saccharibacillus sp. CPCC 101409 TaxID=3058041 RepID=UPI0026719BED|nr:type III-B CRISPR module RAMP protein Cmr4 [Saccharibacillus sp. CPCC 101409]MDO3411203.1 type III-B CRISPR module RAMP protein Cmr4 [Saccharibacillus sp. CPCC 101409]